MNISDGERRVQLEKRFDYQLQLVGRRWQYFATYLILTGLSFATMAKSSSQPCMETQNDSFSFIFSILGVLAGVVFSNLVGLATDRIDRVELEIPRELSVTKVALDGKFFGKSETVLLYFAMYLIIGVHIVQLFEESITFGWVGVGVTIVNLYFLKWKAGVDTRSPDETSPS